MKDRGALIFILLLSTTIAGTAICLAANILRILFER